MEMKNLKDAIYEKLKVDDIKMSKRFPTSGSIDNVIKFLKSEEFKEIKYGTMLKACFDDAKTKCFHQSNDKKRLWFANTSNGKTSKVNPIFLIKYSPQIRFTVFYTENNKTEYVCDNDKEEFLK